MAEHSFSLPERGPLTVLVVGAGGSGSAILLALPYLHQAMRAWGHEGLHVVLMDPDTVSETNCVRQPFAVSDIGQNKAAVLINRVNQFWGLTWQAAGIPFSAIRHTYSAHENNPFGIVIGCVDSRKSRRAINKVLTAKKCAVPYWLDLGNAASHGQFVLGQPLNRRNKKRDRLPTVAELYPEVIDTRLGEDDLPSCSAVEALERQEPFINQTLAMQALAMLTQLLRYGKTTYHGAFFNARTGITQPIAVPEPTPKPRRKK